MLLRFGPDVLDESKVKGTNYEILLKLKDNEISSKQFVGVLKDALTNWPRVDDNLDYWKK